MEKNKKFLFKKYFFTICFLIELLVILITFLINVEIVNFLLIILMPLFLLFFIIYSKDFDKKVKEQEIIPRGGLKLRIILLLIFGGYILSIDIITDIISLISRLIGIILQLIAIGLIFIFFRKIPPFFEFDWEDKIEDIYIMNKDGVSLFHKSYTDNDKTLSSHYVSGILSSVNIMLNELIHSEKNEISIIKKKGKIVTTFSGDYITGVLMSKEELEYFKHNLKKLILKVEEIYKSVLIKWNGDLTIFYPIKNIIDNIFIVD
jgi:predicted regulator of Ras-like GTPase activity (Roadblock/LC7/MglB family)